MSSTIESKTALRELAAQANVVVRDGRLSNAQKQAKLDKSRQASAVTKRASPRTSRPTALWLSARAPKVPPTWTAQTSVARLACSGNVGEGVSDCRSAEPSGRRGPGRAAL
jgi:hypothetical protein